MSEAAVEAVPRRILPEGRLAGPMPWVVAIMMFLAVLSAASGLGLAELTATMASALSGKVTVQIVEANPDLRAAGRAAVARTLRGMSNVVQVEDVGDDRVRAAVAPWLGAEGLDADLPIPALLDVTLRDASPPALADLEAAVRREAKTARVDRHAAWLGPLSALLTALNWLAAILVALTGAALTAAVVLGSHAALDQHRATIDVMHLMGATDRQISRLFERRVAQDAITGSALGFVAAIGVFIVVGWRLDAVAATLVESTRLSLLDWTLVALLPVAGVGLAILSARLTVLRALARIL